MVILAVALVALLGLHTMAAVMQRKAEDTRHAVDWATQQLEHVRKANFAEIDDFAGVYDIPALDTPEAEGRITVEPLQGRDDIKIVTISAEWSGHSKGSLIVKTYVARTES